MIHQLVGWVDKWRTHFTFSRALFSGENYIWSLFFCSLHWWSYFLNDFRVLDDLLRRSWWYIAISYHQPPERTFCDETCFSTVLILLWKGASINLLFWIPFLFFLFKLFFCLSSRFLYLYQSNLQTCFCKVFGCSVHWRLVQGISSAGETSIVVQTIWIYRVYQMR